MNETELRKAIASLRSTMRSLQYRYPGDPTLARSFVALVELQDSLIKILGKKV